MKKNFSKKNLNHSLIAMKISNCNYINENIYKNTENNKFTKVKKLQLKWKTIKWFIENKKSKFLIILDHLDRIFQKLEIILLKFKFSQKLNLVQFTEILKNIGITNDYEFINKLFWVFDEDGSGFIEYKPLVFGLEMFRDTHFDHKIKGIF